MKENYSQTIQIKNGVIGPRDPCARSIRPKKIGDFAGIPGVYLEVAKIYGSTRLLGPPICDELIALVQHMFTQEEASIVRNLGPLKLKSPQAIARSQGRQENEVKKILERLANDKHLVLSLGKENKKRYMLLALVGGAMELVQMGIDVGTPEDPLYDWRKKFAELFEELYKTGYGTDYFQSPLPIIRTLPIGESIEATPLALPSDNLEEVLDRYKKFAVGRCGCRSTKMHIDEVCDRPIEVCTAMGDFVEAAISKGIMRSVSKKEIIEIKRNAEEGGLINWMFNVDEKAGRYGNVMCSCCGCCCDVFRTITEFNTPGMIAPPHFKPMFNLQKCNFCGMCAKRCQLGAITVDTRNKKLSHNTMRCIGCGQCVLACDKQNAIQLRPTPEFKKPAKSWPVFGVKILPNLIRSLWEVWKVRRRF